MNKIKIGDVYEIQLNNGNKAYLQYLHSSPKRGQLVQVFDYINEKNNQPDLILISQSNLLFPPVLTSVTAAVKKGIWKKIGNQPVKSFTYPHFVSTFYDHSNGRANRWFLITEHEDIPIGDSLPAKHYTLEFQAIYSPDLIERRIISGKKPYDTLIRTNVLSEDPTKI